MAQCRPVSPPSSVPPASTRAPGHARRQKSVPPKRDGPVPRDEATLGPRTSGRPSSGASQTRPVRHTRRVPPTIKAVPGIFPPDGGAVTPLQTPGRRHIVRRWPRRRPASPFPSSTLPVERPVHALNLPVPWPATAPVWVRRQFSTGRGRRHPRIFSWPWSPLFVPLGASRVGGPIGPKSPPEGLGIVDKKCAGSCSFFRIRRVQHTFAAFFFAEGVLPPTVSNRECQSETAPDRRSLGLSHTSYLSLE